MLESNFSFSKYRLCGLIQLNASARSYIHKLNEKINEIEDEAEIAKVKSVGAFVNRISQAQNHSSTLWVLVSFHLTVFSTMSARQMPRIRYLVGEKK
jgi:hypothetical protein